VREKSPDARIIRLFHLSPICFVAPAKAVYAGW
jgi:hypothetical protein